MEPSALCGEKAVESASPIQQHLELQWVLSEVRGEVLCPLSLILFPGGPWLRGQGSSFMTWVMPQEVIFKKCLFSSAAHHQSLLQGILTPCLVPWLGVGWRGVSLFYSLSRLTWSSQVSSACQGP